MTHRKAWEQQMIYLMMIDAEEDKQKFAILYETYRHLMMKVALNVLKDTFLAEDAVHEAFIKIAKNMGKNRGNRRHGDETLPAYHNEKCDYRYLPEAKPSISTGNLCG